MKILFSIIFTFLIFSGFSQTFQWVNNIGGLDEDKSYAITSDNHGYVYITGSYSGTADFDPLVGVTEHTSNGITDIFIAKYSSDGILMWSKSIGGTGFDNGFGIDIDIERNILLTGTFQGTVDFDPGFGVASKSSNGDHDVFILKLDSLGDFDWVQTIGNTQLDRGVCVKTDTSGNVYTTGTFLGNFTDFDPGLSTSFISSSTSDIFLLKLNKSGLFEWATALQSNADEDNVTDMTIDSIGNCFLTGFYYGTLGLTGVSSITVSGNNSERDAFVAKIFSTGQSGWLRSIGGTDQDFGEAILVDNSGYVYTGGSFMGISDMDPSSDTTYFTSAGSWDAFLHKMDTSGNFVWAKQIEGMSTEQIHSIVQLSNGNILSNGLFGGMVDFDPGPSQSILSVPGWGSADFFWTLSSIGDFVDAKMLSVTGKMTLSSDGSLYTSGAYIGTADFDCDENGISYLSNPSDYNIFVAKYDVNQPTTVVNSSKNEYLEIFPNPSSNYFTVNLPSDLVIETIELYSIIGEKITTDFKKNGTKLTFSLGNNPNGVYLLKTYHSSKNWVNILLKK